MTDKDTSKSKSTLLMTIVSALIIVVGIQAWFMADLRRQLDELQGRAAGPQAADQQPKPQIEAGDAPAKQPQNPPVEDDWRARGLEGQNWDPYQEIQGMQREMDRMFNDAFSRFDSSPDFQHLYRGKSFSPDIDLNDEGDRYVILVDLPGTKENNISVRLQNQRLTITGTKDYEEHNTDSSGNIIYRERRSGSFNRSITLPEPVKQSGMQTEMDNGVLTVTIPKAG
jgi:HSP20 family protein